jgi:hypothetical protein
MTDASKKTKRLRIIIRNKLLTADALRITPAVSISADQFADKNRHKKFVFDFIFTLHTNSRHGRILNHFAGDTFCPSSLIGSVREI